METLALTSLGESGWIASMIGFLGISIGLYAKTYLARDSKQGRFYLYFCVTIIAALFFVFLNQVPALFLAWLTLGYGIHQLLILYSDRPLARRAAQLKWWVSRLGDGFLLAAGVLYYRITETTLLVSSERVSQFYLEHPVMSEWMMVILVIGTLMKSAQFPFHFWLPETMETPAPVSALMHAGVVNAGGILLFRLRPWLEVTEVAQILLLLSGAMTAVFGALVMVTQNDIKKKLAYSTVSQMGIMMYLYGLGASQLALLHMIGHSLYKSYAFLTTGSLVKISEPRVGGQTRHYLPFWLPVALSTLFLVAGRFVQEGAYFYWGAYGAVLWLGLGFDPLRQDKKSSGAWSRRVLWWSIVGIVVVVLIRWIHPVLESGGAGHLVSHADQQGGLYWGALLLAHGIFLAGFQFYRSCVGRVPARWQPIYVWIWNGGYLADRVWSRVNRNEIVSQETKLRGV